VSVKIRSLEAQAILVGVLIGAFLGLLSGAGLFSPLSCPAQGFIGLLGSAAVGVLTAPVALRRSPQPLVRGIIVYSVLVVLSTMMTWPVTHTMVLLAGG